MGKKIVIESVVEQLIEEWWHAEDRLQPLSKADRAAVRKALLALAKEDPSSDVMQVLGQFPDAEVLAVLQKALRDDDLDADVHEAAAEAICEMNLPAAKALVPKLVDSENPDVARTAIENLSGKPTVIVKLLLPRVDELAKRSDDLLMAAVVTKLVEAAPKDKAVIAAIARHWNWGDANEDSYFASNAIFDALLEHAPTNPDARAAFAAAIAGEGQYGKVRGHAALALTTDNITEHVAALNKLKGLKPSGSSLRKSALQELVKKRKPELQKLAKAGDKVAAKLLK